MSDLHLEPLTDIESAREIWQPLADRSGNVFSTWEWAACWWEAFGRDRPLMLASLRDGQGETVALLPLYLSARWPVRTVRFLGHGPADQLGPVCDPDRLDEVMATLASELSGARFPWSVFMAERLPGDRDWSALLGARTLAREPSPLVRTGGRSWDEYLAERSRNFREQVKRRRRKLAREHDLSFRLTTLEQFDGDFTTLLRLHRERWGEDSQVFAGPLEDFHRNFALRALERGWLRLWVMEVNGQPVAAWYGYRYGSVEYYFNSGRDRAWDQYRVGFVLLVHTMEAAFEDGMREYRMLRGEEEYKNRFATDDAEVATVALARGAGRAVSALGSAARRTMPLGVRQRLARLAGS